MKLLPLVLFTMLAVQGGCAAMTAPHGASAMSVVESGAVAGRVRIMKGRRFKTSHADAVVYLVGVAEKLPSTRNAVTEIRQIDRRFVPDVVVVLKGTTIAFPNDDRDYHNVYSLSPACEFDLGQYKSGTSESVKCRKPGDVAVYCNLHDDMAAKILVLETQYYARANREGEFRIDGVPPGTYTFVAWQPWGKPATGKVRVAGGDVAEIDVTLKEGRKPQPSYCADGSLRGSYGCKD